MTPEIAALVRQTWAEIKPRRKQVCGDFYQRLFARYPEVRPLFKGDMERQAGLLVAMIDTVVSALENPDPVVPLIKTVGARHAGYGVTDADYDKFADALLETLEHSLGDAFTPERRAAWIDAYSRLADTMKQGAGE